MRAAIRSGRLPVVKGGGRGFWFSRSADVRDSRGNSSAAAVDDGESGWRDSGQREAAHPGLIETMPEHVVDRQRARSGQGQRGCAETKNARELEPAVAGKEAVVEVHGGGDDHGAGDRCARARRSDAGGQQRSAAGLTETGRDRADLARPEADALKASGGLLQAGATEPAEEPLRAVRAEGAANAQPKGEQSEIARTRHEGSR